MPFRSFLSAFILLSMLAACAPAPALPSPAPAADLAGIKQYLLEKNVALETSASALQTAAAEYFDLAQTVAFDSERLWADHPTRAAELLSDARAAWMTASPLYEQMEGVVAGVPTLSHFDVLLDAGGSGSEAPDNAAPYDLTLADGRVLVKPGNLFGVLESTLWGTEPAFTALPADLDASGAIDFGEALPDAQVLKAAADTLTAQVSELEITAQAWQPTESDAFTALVVMIPTMNEYFNSWKASRFVSGETSTQRDFVAISRLADIQDILTSLQAVYAEIKPLTIRADTTQAAQTEQALTELKAFVSSIHTQETGGKRFSPEEADILGAEAQNRATAIAGQISQIAAKLNITIAE